MMNLDISSIQSGLCNLYLQQFTECQGLIWVQTVWHIDDIPVNFGKSILKKNSTQQKDHQKFPSMQKKYPNMEVIYY